MKKKKGKNINRTFIHFEYKKKKTQIIYRTLMSLYFVSGSWFQIATIVFQLYFNYDIEFNISYKKNMRHGP